ncbi:MAG TPA: hypothetical protein VE982_00890 [Gaiellaceae bacterium]|nr:hypothetical protein [Gaiellaceae bacterium]
MKRSLTLGITLLSIAAAALTAGQALATTSTHAKTAKTLDVVMHDPGCHWFAVGSKFALTATVAGPVKVANLDEATLKVTGKALRSGSPSARSSCSPTAAT